MHETSAARPGVGNVSTGLSIGAFKRRVGCAPAVSSPAHWRHSRNNGSSMASDSGMKACRRLPKRSCTSLAFDLGLDQIQVALAHTHVRVGDVVLVIECGLSRRYSSGRPIHMPEFMGRTHRGFSGRAFEYWAVVLAVELDAVARPEDRSWHGRLKWATRGRRRVARLLPHCRRTLYCLTSNSRDCTTAPSRVISTLYLPTGQPSGLLMLKAVTPSPLKVMSRLSSLTT